MKKLFAIIIVSALLAASLTACGSGGNNDTTTTTPAAAESTSSESAETSAEPTDTSAPESTEDIQEPAGEGEAAKVLDAIKTAYGEDYLPSMPVDEIYLTSVMGLEEGSFTDYAGELPMISAHADMAVIVKAAEGKSGEEKQSWKLIKPI